MPCWKPSTMYEEVSPRTGVVNYRFKPLVASNVVREFKVGCGQCSGCRSKSTRQWAIRAYHESLSHVHSCFITLTVNSDFHDIIFPGGSVCYEPFQKFIRAFRKKVKVPIRFFMCAEYGPKLDRPHYHAVIFGWFPELSDIISTRQDAVGKHHTCHSFNDLWPYGFHDVATFDMGCAQYVAGYIQKKINGKMKESWYGGLHPEFAKMSLKPGIGETFYKKYTSDLFRRDRVELPGGGELPIPRYYDKLHALYHPSHMSKLKAKRQLPNPIRDAENTPERLAVRKVIHEKRLSFKSRSFEQGA